MCVRVCCFVVDVVWGFVIVGFRQGLTRQSRMTWCSQPSCLSLPLCKNWRHAPLQPALTRRTQLSDRARAPEPWLIPTIDGLLLLSVYLTFVVL